MADETARASFDVMKDLFLNASRLNSSSVSTRPNPIGCHPSAYRPPQSDDELTTQSYTSDGQSDTSGALHKDDDSASIGYTFEHPQTRPESKIQGTSSGTQSSNLFPWAFGDLSLCDSPGARTLGSLKQEALLDQTRTTGGIGKSTKKVSTRRG